MRNSRWFVVAVVTSAACGKGSSGEAAPSGPYEGPLTIERVMRAKGLVEQLEPWDAALARLQSVVGAPTKIEGDRHYWAVLEGEACAYFYVSRKDGEKYGKTGPVVAGSSAPATIAKDGPVGNRRTCLRLVGKAEP